jgi:hypothetical protein
MKRWFTLLATLAITTTVSVTTLLAESITIVNVARPPREFLDHGDVIGLSPADLATLKVETGAVVALETADGQVRAFPVRQHGNRAGTLFMKQTLRDSLGIQDGPNNLTIRTLDWPERPIKGMKVEQTRVVRPPEAFLEKGDAVGIGLAAFRELKAKPGTRAAIRGPKGARMVTLELLDRGTGVVAMKKTLRDAIGVEEGDAKVIIEVAEGAAAPAAGAAASTTWLTLQDAIKRASADNKPILLLARESDTGPRPAILDAPATQAVLEKVHAAEVDPGTSPALIQRFGITKYPTLLIVTRNGAEVARLTAEPTAEALAAFVNTGVAMAAQPPAPPAP